MQIIVHVAEPDGVDLLLATVDHVVVVVVVVDGGSLAAQTHVVVAALHERVIESDGQVGAVHHVVRRDGVGVRAQRLVVGDVDIPDGHVVVVNGVLALDAIVNGDVCNEVLDVIGVGVRILGAGDGNEAVLLLNRVGLGLALRDGEDLAVDDAARLVGALGGVNARHGPHRVEGLVHLAIGDVDALVGGINRGRKDDGVVLVEGGGLIAVGHESPVLHDVAVLNIDVRRRSVGVVLGDDQLVDELRQGGVGILEVGGCRGVRRIVVVDIHIAEACDERLVVIAPSVGELDAHNAELGDAGVLGRDVARQLQGAVVLAVGLDDVVNGDQLGALFLGDGEGVLLEQVVGAQLVEGNLALDGIGEGAALHLVLVDARVLTVVLIGLALVVEELGDGELAVLVALALGAQCDDGLLGGAVVVKHGDDRLHGAGVEGGVIGVVAVCVGADGVLICGSEALDIQAQDAHEQAVSIDLSIVELIHQALCDGLTILGDVDPDAIALFAGDGEHVDALVIG